MRVKTRAPEYWRELSALQKSLFLMNLSGLLAFQAQGERPHSKIFFARLPITKWKTCRLFYSRGSEKQIRAPVIDLGSAQIRPPWASMIARARYKPSPAPLVLRLVSGAR